MSALLQVNHMEHTSNQIWRLIRKQTDDRMKIYERITLIDERNYDFKVSEKILW